MKYYYAFILLFFFTISVGQSFDDMISSNRAIDCRDVTYSASSIIGDLYANNEMIKIYDFLDYWQSKCGNIEAIDRLRTILDINGNRFSPTSISESTIEALLFYRGSINNKNDSIPLENSYYQKINSIDSLTQKIAKDSNSGSLDEQLLIDFYANENPSFDKIKRAPYYSKLKGLHSTVYGKTLRMWELHFAYIGGAILNYGNISVFGTRPHIGGILGGKTLKHTIDVVFDIRIGSSAEEYSFVYQGDLITDDTWTGIYFGAEYTYDFFNSRKINLGISPGIAYESIVALSTDEDDDDDGKNLPSFNSNIGLVFKYRYGKSGAYLGLHLRYNWVDYRNRGGTQLDGQYLNIRLALGNIFNANRNFRLKNLE
ncbi:hypothetical protein [Winogradskyella sp.]|uniref:hypothetical protein n=1 Tax=Winogradskyella sp. TaxID=1883156 RepID=UPI002603B8DB|nr:hypothetical protein [Winogradskyella sp.]